MRIVTFQPRASPRLERIREYGPWRGDHPLRRAAVALESTLRGEGETRYRQTTWMGRGCFAAVTATRFLSAKGTGPGPGSEAVRVALDTALRDSVGGSGSGGGGIEGGCVRLETGGFHPLLVPFRRRDGTWEVTDPRPEGFSMFGHLVREAEAAAVYQAIGVPTPAPLRLLRRREAIPWTEDSRDALARYLTGRVSGIIRAHLDDAIDRPIACRGLTYCHMDGGVLMRSARSPFRIANLQTAAATRDTRFLRYLAAHTVRLWGVASDNPLTADAVRFAATRLVTQLARSAAALFAEGVLHDRLGQHHQNITLAAEIADLDATLFLRTQAWHEGEPPFPGDTRGSPGDSRVSTMQPTYARFWTNIRQAERDLGIDVLSVIDADTDRLGGAGRQDARWAAAMLRQLFEVWTQALRAADLLHRALGSSPDAPGTVLPVSVSRELMAIFTSTVARELARRRGIELFAWAARHGFDRLMHRFSESTGTRTIHGWSHPTVPVESLRQRCEPARTAHIVDDANRFFAALGR